MKKKKKKKVENFRHTNYIEYTRKCGVHLNGELGIYTHDNTLEICCHFPKQLFQ